MAEEASPVSYEDLAAIEDEFEEVDSEIMRKQYALSQTVYNKRADAVSKILHFWPLVIEQAPPEIDQYIQPQDSRIFSEHLKSIAISRPELDRDASNGNPRSMHIKFEFSTNEFFTNTSLEKTFWHRRAKDGWAGLVSEPVKVHWKKGKDLTEGLTDAAVALFGARKKVGDVTAKGLPEYTALERKVEHLNGANTSFFTWFGFATSGDAEAPTEEEDDAENDDQAVEVHEAGEEVAICLADDVWPNAIKYFMQAQEVGDMSDPEFEEDGHDEDEDDEDDEPVDIRSLVQGKDKGRMKDSNGPPTKKVKR
ncbi:hypothetical protein BAUCODRAFT_74627 [Baudoinia panamericana UAMH 10762]|uniref:Nucleosome assembly protein n=1 Tax=Baudoinia panamericana (strain UAMH 10762) TaxID=717646 RepID=M2N5B1_BAUPA|nr:uncharacterized protein BAUCODRAFT_74627 [Baudoinia panamericana UAMH 10762]EMC94229.1 hypothetical protein BAUCODRAFT_74627 [Baudoinia panamericana UAMH 10762]